jgi:molybdopterin converting factor small subunit
MQVTVKLYATLRRFGRGRRAGTPLKVDLPEEATLLELINQLKIPPAETRIVFVNGIIQEPGWRLKEGDEVGMFPPIGGG